MTIHVLTYPERWIEKLKYQIWGTMPTVSCEEMRFGPGVIEAINGDRCTMIPFNGVSQMYFDSGYKSALAKVRQEANENAAIQLQNLIPPGEDGEMPYVAPAKPPSVYDYS